MPKISPHTLNTRPQLTWTENFKQWHGDRYVCKCGWAGELDRCPYWVQPEEGKEDKHVLTENKPDVVIPMVFRRLSKSAVMAAADMAEAMIEKYVTGVGDKDRPGYIPPEVMMPLNGVAVPVSENHCTIGAILEMAQYCPPEDRYTFEEIVTFLADDSLYNQLMLASAKVQPSMGEKKEGPLDSEKSAAASLSIASDATPSVPPPSLTG